MPEATEPTSTRVIRALMGRLTPVLRAVVGSRFHAPLSGTFMLLRFRGRKSGRVFTTPVGYTREDQLLTVVTSRTYRWWRNVVEPTAVALRLRGTWLEGTGRVVEPVDPAYPNAVQRILRVRGLAMAQRFGLVDAEGAVLAEPRDGVIASPLIVEVRLESAADSPGE